MLKHILAFFVIILLFLPVVYSEEKSWYEIDGIKFRNGEYSNNTKFMLPGEDDTEIISIPIESKFSHLGQKPMTPVAITLAETLMGSFSFRGALFEYEVSTEVKDLVPSDGSGTEVQDDTTYLLQEKERRTSLYNNFFNASDKSFADANPNWALSADVTSSRIFLGYYLGVFIPTYETQRFMKIGVGLGMFYSDLSYKLNLCSQYKVSRKLKEDGSRESGVYNGKCVGKTEIDSTSGKIYGAAGGYNIVFWERVTKDSMWRIFAGTGMTSWEDTRVTQGLGIFANAGQFLN